MGLNKVRTKNQQLLINIVAQLLSFGVNIGIGFFLTPYIIETVGSTAYGFVGLANNFVSYVQILTIALNSMAGRFIAISFYKDKMEDVKKYYTSVLFANLFISLVLSVPITLALIYLDKIVNVPVELLSDVRLLWAFLFGTMIISIVGSIFSNAAYVRNRLELISMRTIESNVLKAVLLIGTFSLLAAKVWYVGLASLVCGLYVMCINVYYTKKLMPFVEIKKSYFDFQKIKELIISGVWNSISQLGSILSTGLDLLITNLFVGAGPMGIVSVSKTIPTYVQSLFITVSSVFAPQLTISYAQDDIEDVKRQLSTAMKIMGLFASIPIAVIASYGTAFYHLWTPSQDARMLMLLTGAAVLEYPVSLLVYPLENIFVTTNKVKISSLTTIICSLCSCITVFIVVPRVNNEFGKMLVVVGVSCLYNLIKNTVFIPKFCARILKINAGFFYTIIGKSVISTGVLVLIALLIKSKYTVSSWMQLILAICLIAIIGLSINVVFLLNRRDREVLWTSIKSKMNRR